MAHQGTQHQKSNISYDEKKKQGKPKLKVKINITPQTKAHILKRISLQKI